MQYREIFDKIYSELMGKDQFQPYAFLNYYSKEDYDKATDLINFLMSRCILKFASQGHSDFTIAITWTKLGKEQLSEPTKANNLFQEFKTLFDLSE